MFLPTPKCRHRLAATCGLHKAASANADARLAIQMFCYSVRKQVAAMIAALDGVDLIVFTGGIGENDGEARAAICGGLSWIGVRLDAGRNWFANNPINDPASRCSVLVLASREDEQIARHTWALFPRSLSNRCRKRLLKRPSAKASTSADVVQALIEIALQSDMEPKPAVQQKREVARQMRDPFVRPKAARLQLSRPCWKRSSHWQVIAARSAVHCLPRCKACHRY